jgi:uncharacterized membrane protein YgdD (TMEM256/DUF423 family)
MRSRWVVLGAAVGFVGVLLGAFGAHALGGRLDERHLAWWQTGVLYQLLHAAPLVGVGLLPAGRSAAVAGWAFGLGVLVFSGSLYGLALGGPAWLGAVTPFGGVGLLLGWLALGLAGWANRS